MVSAALTLLAQRIDAAPAAPSPAPNISLTTRAFKGPACRDVHSCRTLWEILYSCLVTTFACTYLSYHPDVPDLTYTAWRIRAIRSCTTAISFLMPELVVAKAASQWWEVWKYDFPFEGMRVWDVSAIGGLSSTLIKRLDPHSLIFYGHGWFH